MTETLSDLIMTHTATPPSAPSCFSCIMENTHTSLGVKV